MKRVLPRLILLTIMIGFAYTAAAEQTPNIELRYYGDISCDHCDTFEAITVPDLEERYGVQITVEAVDIMRAANRTEVSARLETYGRRYRIFPVLFIGNNAYQGHSEIERHLEPEIAYRVEQGRFRDHLPEVPTDEPATSATDAGRLSATDDMVLRYFWAIGCPVCDRAIPVLDELEARYPQISIRRYEVSQNRENLEYFRRTATDHGTAASGVPAFFFAGHAWIGMRAETPSEIAEAIDATLAGSGGPGSLPSTIELPLFGTISLQTAPAIAVTAAIAAVDGFNPCSLWVLTFLIGLIVRTGSRGRTILVGGVFLGVTAAVYGLFMLGLFQIFAAATGLIVVRAVVALLAVAMGVINMKDYFAFKAGFSLTIPERFQTGIARRARLIFEKSGSPLLLIAATAVFALGISVVELPCTAGFPVIWSQYVASLNPAPATFQALLGLYLLVYLGDELIVVGVSVLLMRRLTFAEGHARTLKLLGGAIMAAIGLAYLFAPEATRTMTGVGTIFGSAVLFTILVLLLGRFVLHRPNRDQPNET